MNLRTCQSSATSYEHLCVGQVPWNQFLLLTAIYSDFYASGLGAAFFEGEARWVHVEGAGEKVVES